MRLRLLRKDLAGAHRRAQNSYRTDLVEVPTDDKFYGTKIWPDTLLQLTVFVVPVARLPLLVAIATNVLDSEMMFLFIC